MNQLCCYTFFIAILYITMTKRLPYEVYDMLKTQQMQSLPFDLHNFNINYFSSYGTPSGITNAQFREFMMGEDGLMPNRVEYEDDHNFENANYDNELHPPRMRDSIDLDEPPISRQVYLQYAAPYLLDTPALRNPIDTPPSKRPKTTGFITSGGSRRRNRYGKKSRRRYGKKSRRR